MSLEQAEALLNTGAYLKARREVERLLSAGGMTRADEGRAHFLACRAALGLKDPFTAAQSGERAVKLAEEEGHASLLAQIHFHLGSAFAEIGDTHRAEHHLMEFLRHEPRSARTGQALLHLARVHRQRKEWSKAVSLLERAEESLTGPRQAGAALEIAWCRLMAGQPAAADGALERAGERLHQSPDDGLQADLLAYRALARRMQGDLGGSSALCQELFMPGRRGAGDAQLALAAWVMGENALDLRQPEQASYFSRLAMNHAVKSGRSSLMNLAGELRRKLITGG